MVFANEKKKENVPDMPVDVRSVNHVILLDVDVAGRKKAFEVVTKHCTGIVLSLSAPFMVCYPCHLYLLCLDEGNQFLVPSLPNKKVIALYMKWRPSWWPS